MGWWLATGVRPLVNFLRQWSVPPRQIKEGIFVVFVSGRFGHQALSTSHSKPLIAL